MTTITLSTNAGKIKNGINTVAANIPKLTKRQLKITMEAARKIARGGWPSGGGPGGYSIAQPPKTKYKRTGTYGRRMTITESGLSYILKSDAKNRGRSYSPYVGGNAYGAGQARIHAGRWPLVSEAVSAQVRALVASIENDIEVAARAAGVGP